MLRSQLAEYRQAGRLVPAALYLRKSRAEEHMSLEETLARHKATLTACAQRDGYLIVDTYEEVLSGESLFARPEMLRLMEAVSAGKYAAVLVMDMQRLGRGGMYDQGLILDTFKGAETLIVTPERIYDLTQDMDEQAAEMETFLSRGEYRMITKRLHRGALQSVQNGAYMANAPFGYRKARVDRMPTLEIVPEEAEAVRRIFERYRDGWGCSRIQEELNALGYHGRRGSNFNRNTIRVILTNPVYIGKIRWNHNVTVKSGVGAARTKKIVPGGDREFWVDGRHPAIIDRELWDRVQEIHAGRYIRVEHNTISNPLAGIMHCSKCGARINLMRNSAKGPYLLCPTRGCTAAAKFGYVEQAVLARLEELADTLEIQLAQAKTPDVTGQQRALEQLRAQAAKLQARRARLYDLLEDGTYTRELFAQRMEVLDGDEARVNAAIASTEAEIRAATSRSQERQLQQLRTVLQLYQGSDVAARKSLLHSVIADILYAKTKKSKPADFTIDVQLRDFWGE